MCVLCVVDWGLEEKTKKLKMKEKKKRVTHHRCRCHAFSDDDLFLYALLTPRVCNHKKKEGHFWLGNFWSFTFLKAHYVLPKFIRKIMRNDQLTNPPHLTRRLESSLLPRHIYSSLWIDQLPVHRALICLLPMVPSLSVRVYVLCAVCAHVCQRKKNHQQPLLTSKFTTFTR